MKKVLIVCSVALAMICMLNVRLVTRNNSGKTAQIVSLNKALAGGENDNQLPPYEVPSSSTPPTSVDLGATPPGIVDIGPNPPIDLGDPAETLKGR